MTLPVETIVDFGKALGFSEQATRAFAYSFQNDINRTLYFLNLKGRVQELWQKVWTRGDNWILWGTLFWAGSNQRFIFMNFASIVLFLSPASDTVHGGVSLLKSLDEKWDKWHWAAKCVSIVGLVGFNYVEIPFISTIARGVFSAITGAATGLLLYNTLKDRIIDQAVARGEVTKRKKISAK